jgi:hypothetical protein
VLGFLAAALVAATPSAMPELPSISLRLLEQTKAYVEEIAMAGRPAPGLEPGDRIDVTEGASTMRQHGESDTNVTSPVAPAAESVPLESAAPWWEKITVTVDDKGKQQSCRYETSAAGVAVCDRAMAASIETGGKGTQGFFKKVTFERRFSPGGLLDAGKLQPGDRLLGRQVMFLTIDAKGAITSCKLVATSGDVPPEYGCEEAKKEQFTAKAGPGGTARQAFMTVLAYGHTEHIA